MRQGERVVKRLRLIQHRRGDERAFDEPPPGAVERPKIDMQTFQCRDLERVNGQV